MRGEIYIITHTEMILSNSSSELISCSLKRGEECDNNHVIKMKPLIVELRPIFFFFDNSASLKPKCLKQQLQTTSPMEESSNFIHLGIPRGMLPFDKPAKPVRVEGKTPGKY